MKARSAEKTTVTLSFNETDIDRSMPVCEDDGREEAANETIEVDVPEIKAGHTNVSKIESRCLPVVDAKALV